MVKIENFSKARLLSVLLAAFFLTFFSVLPDANRNYFTRYVGPFTFELKLSLLTGQFEFNLVLINLIQLVHTSMRASSTVWVMWKLRYEFRTFQVRIQDFKNRENL